MQKKIFKLIGMMVLFGNIGFSEYKARDGKVYYNIFYELGNEKS